MVAGCSTQLIYDLSLEELIEVLNSWGEPPYRARQIWHGLYQSLWSSSEQFRTLPLALRKKLSECFSFSSLKAEKFLLSRDGQTLKTMFRLPDQRVIEAVVMTYTRRNSLCISTQAGCAMGCVFCATGQMGFQRNLSSGEIIEQVVYYSRFFKQQGKDITNIVVMGMGEPFHNYEATLKALDCMNAPEGLNIGARRFTISTVGLVPAIRKFAHEGRQYNLAVSLHAANDELRSALLPINRKYPLDVLLAACREYVELTRRRISFEWALIRDVNDSPNHARELAQRLQGLLCHVNVIPLNPTRGYNGEATTRERAFQFRAELERHGIPCTIRLRRGIDIQAGCGQLASSSSVSIQPTGNKLNI